MATIKKSVVINAPVARVYDYLTNPENLLEVWPSMHKVDNVQMKEDGAHSFDWTYRMAGVPFHGHSETREVERNKRRVLRNDSGIPSTFTWTYEERGANQMQLGVEIDYEIPGRIIERLAEPFVRRVNEREAETLMANLKERFESEAAASKGGKPTEVRP